MSPAKKPSNVKKAENTARNHPAEVATFGAALAALLTSVGFEVSEGTFQILVAVLALIPAGITYWRVTRG